MPALDATQHALRTGPRRPMPFPDTGKTVKLAQCPKCGQKGMLLYYAPTEHAYPTKCVKCDARHVVKRNDRSLREIQQAGGFTPRADGMRDSQRFGIDATRFYDRQRDMESVGLRRAYRQGMVGRSVDLPLRVKSGF